MQLKNRLERERSNDTNTDSSNVTVIEGHVPIEVEEDIVVVDNEISCDKFNNVVNMDGADSINNAPSSSNGNAILPSCLFRRDSARASVKKKVRCSETAEIIPPTDYFINNITEVITNSNNVTEDDEDDVFSDSAPAQVPRGNMCTPYVPRKGSLPISEALPDWFPNSRFISLSRCYQIELKFICKFFLLLP